jgi:cell filamentation protein
VTFDPFGDFETRGYLRNVAKAKDPAVVQRLQHNSFLTGIDMALVHLESQPTLAYGDVLHTHETLFEGVFPWAGEDRLVNAPDLFVTKGTVLFAHPKDIRKAIDYALQKAQDKAFMRQKPGEVMGYLAHALRDGATGSVADAIKAAPGLDGNNADAVAGRTDDPALKAQYEAQELKRQNL